jgi:mannose-1-phosphate guanylyltransferase
MIHAVVMAGGSGTRFWPLSRRRRPKQLLPVTGGLPMVAETVARIGALVPPERTWVVTHRDQADGVRDALPKVPRAQILAEPTARNTCACAALAAAVIGARDPDATLVVMPADHDIRPPEEFVKTILAACGSVEAHGGLMVFGVKPTYPATGYGYIHRGEVLHESRGVPVRQVLAFREKPDAAKAAEFLSTGEYSWNSGIFVWKASRVLEAVASFEPEVAAGARSVAAALDNESGDFFGPRAAAALEKAYATMPSKSIDVAVLERAPDVRVIEIGYRWSDVGSWDALDDLLTPGAAGHRAAGAGASALTSIDSRGCVVHNSEKHDIALVGVDDLIVVHTADATLICKRGRAEDVKRVVDELARRGRGELL